MSGYERYLASVAGMLGGSPVDTSWHNAGGGTQIRVEPHERDSASAPAMDTSHIVSPREAAQMNGNPEVILRTFSCAGQPCTVTHTYYGRAAHAPIEPLYCPEHAPEGHVNRTRGPADVERERHARMADRNAHRNRKDTDIG